MELFLVSYDLIAGKDYQRIINRLTALGAKRVLLSAWALRSSSSASDLLNDLKNHIDNDDRLVVVRVSDWATYNALISMKTI